MMDRFEAHFSPEPNTGCWLWTGTADAKGYGMFHVGSRTDGSRTVMRAHRASWTIYRSPIPDGLCVLHRCDVPACVNPEHLFLGTVADNVADMIAKGRARLVSEFSVIRRGADHPQFGWRKDACKHGHQYTPENTLISYEGSRRCRQCREASLSAASRRSYLKRKGAVK